jgi:hypothetical protein
MTERRAFTVPDTNPDRPVWAQAPASRRRQTKRADLLAGSRPKPKRASRRDTTYRHGQAAAALAIYQRGPRAGRSPRGLA